MKQQANIKLTVSLILMLTLMSCGQNFESNIESSEKTPHNIGVYSTGYMHSKKSESGFLVFGPYAKLNPGSYLAAFEVQSLGEDPNCKEAGFVDVNKFDPKTSIGTQLAKAFISCDPKQKSIELSFNVDKDDDYLYEFRVFTNGINSIKFKNVKISKSNNFF